MPRKKGPPPQVPLTKLGPVLNSFSSLAHTCQSGASGLVPSLMLLHSWCCAADVTAAAVVAAASDTSRLPVPLLVQSTAAAAAVGTGRGGSHRQSHRLLLLPADDCIDVHLSDVRAVDRQRTLVVGDDKGRVLDQDIDAQLRPRKEIEVRLVSPSKVSRAPVGKVEVRVLVAACALPQGVLQERGSSSVSCASSICARPPPPWLLSLTLMFRDFWRKDIFLCML